MKGRTLTSRFSSSMPSHADHYKRHKDLRQCVRCIWATNSFKWKRKLQVLSDEVLGGAKRKAETLRTLTRAAQFSGKSWMYLRKDDHEHGGYVIACRFCEDFKPAQARYQYVKRHHESRRHIGKVQVQLGLQVGPSSIPIDCAPKEKEFAQILSKGVHSGSVEGVGGRSKVALMQKCLAQAFQEACRACLLEASTICLMRDESAGFLQVRARVCSSNLNCRSFLLGISRQSGSDAYDIHEETVAIIKRFLGDDHISKLQDILDRVEAVTVDSASSELKAARLAKTFAQYPMPNLIATLRDRTHSARRVVQRGFKATDRFKDLAEKYIHGRRSITQRIHRSDHFKKIYKDHVERLGGSFGKTGNMGAALHRYESTAKPMTQFVMTIEAILATAEVMSVERQDQFEGKDADEFLTNFSTEEYMMMACMSDCAAEGIWLVRVYDETESDMADLVRDVQVFKANVKKLCNNDGGFAIPDTYMHHAVTFLEKGQTTFSVRAGMAVNSIGGVRSVTPELKQTCLQSMREWMEVANSILDAEFPSFELVQCFEVLQLSDRRNSKKYQAHQSNEVIEAHCERLAEVFKVDAVQLQRDIRLFKYAATQARRYQHSHADAWTDTLQRRPPGATFPALREVMIRYLGWAISTCTVERAFVTVRKELLHRTMASEEVMSTVMRLAEAKSQEDKTEWVIGRAQEIWAERYGAARLTCMAADTDIGEARLHGNSLHKRVRDDDVTESAAAWLRKRRRSIDTAPGTADSTPDAGVAKSASVAEEQKFNEKKHHLRKIEALGFGHLLPHENSQGLLDDARDQADKQAKLDDGLLRKRQKKMTRLSSKGIALKDIKEKPCFISRSATKLHSITEIVPLLQNRVMKVTDLPHVIIVLSVAGADECGRTSSGMMARLLGCYMVSAGSLTGMTEFQRDAQVACNKFQASVSFWRMVLMSKLFAEKHKKLANIIRVASQSTVSKWRVLEDTTENRAKMAEAYAKASAKKIQFCLILTKGEKDNPSTTNNLPATMKRFLLDEFVASINKPEPETTTSTVALTCRPEKMMQWS